MKKAFTLLELTLSCVIFALLLTLVSKTLKESHYFNLRALKNQQMLSDLNVALLQTEKILSNCLKIQISSKSSTCLLRDDENILDLDSYNRAYLMNSTLILDNNTSLYSPKSRFLKILQNRKDLYKDNEKKLYVLVQNELKSLKILNNEELKADFVGTFLPLEAKLDLILKDKKLLYELRPKIENDSLKQSGVLAYDVSVFELHNKAGDFILKLCMQKENLELCLQKRLYL